MPDRTNDTPLRIGVVRAGAFGRHHVQHCVEEPATTLIGVAVTASDIANLAHELGVPHYRSSRNMLDAQGEPLVSAKDTRRSLQVTAAILRPAATGEIVAQFELHEAAS